MKNSASFLKNIFLFKPEKETKPFVLEETGGEGGGQNEDSSKDQGDRSSGQQNQRDGQNKRDIQNQRSKSGSQNHEDGGAPDKAQNNGNESKAKEQEQAKGQEQEQLKRQERGTNEEQGKRKGQEREQGQKQEQGIKGEQGKKQKQGTKRRIKKPIDLLGNNHSNDLRSDNNSKSRKKANEDGNIDLSLKVNLEVIKKRYNSDINGDFKIREFKIRIRDEMYSAFVCFFDGMVDRLVVNTTILQPLMTLSILPMDAKEQSAKEIVYNNLLPHNQIKMCKTYQEIVDEVNFGGIGIFVDKINVAFAGDVKGWEHRNVEKPTSELNIRGPKESFNETNRVNTALIRKTIKDENLIVEDVLVGERSKTPCSILYIKNIANESLVEEVRKRLKSIKIAYLRDAGELEQMLEDSTYLPAPQMILTERPDRVTAYLGEGRIAIIVHGSPFVIIAPINIFNLIHSPEDYYIRYPYATFLRSIRIVGILFSTLLPSFYHAVTTYHQEMLPTDLLLAIAASREKVPFPTIVSILIMEIAFELIREAGIRIPGPIGPTLGIVGALILGQAAVAANLVSPILIIIVAVTGIGSFAVPDFSLGYSFRALRFIYLLLSSLAGLLGISLGIFINLLVLVHAKSFGVPFMSPFAPKTTGKRTNAILKTPLWKEEDRPDFVNPKDVKQQPFISRGWVKTEKGVKENESKN